MTEANGTPGTAPKTRNETTPANSKVKRVIMPVPKRNEEKAKPDSKVPANTGSKSDERQRRVGGKP